MYGKIGNFVDRFGDSALNAIGLLILLLTYGLRRRLRTSYGQLQSVEMQTITKEIKVEKAYDIKVLAAKLKARGLDVAEEAAKIMVEETCAWIVESSVVSENKIDDVVALGIPQLKVLALGLADKIDGQEG